MEFNEKDMLLIEKYLDGQLLGKELEAFNSRLKTDEDFAMAFELRQKMPALMKDALEFETTREEVRVAIQQEKELIFGFNRNWIYAAATIVILIGLFVVIKLSNNDESVPGNRIAKENHEEVLKVDHPINYAKLNELDEKVELIGPLNFQAFNKGDQVILKWNTESQDTAKLFLTKFNEKEILFETEILLSNREFILHNPKLSTGNYSWYINDTVLRGSFKVEPN